jgi:DNA-binding LytR/AlgR family response regulator
MKVLIVENEKPAADKIVRMLGSIDKTIVVSSILETVESTVNWLQTNENPDLILMDVHLDDGLCFEIFETINVDIPVIFITAYDEYSLRAFKVNSVDYLLKPVDQSALKTSIDKFRKYHNSGESSKSGIVSMLREFSPHYKTRFLVRIGSKYRSVPVSDIPFFHISERNVFLRDNNGRDYGLDSSLENLQKLLDPDRFFRINRDCIVSLDAISLIQSYSSSRLQLVLKNEKNEKNDELFVVSREKVSEFKKWVDR